MRQKVYQNVKKHMASVRPATCTSEGDNPWGLWLALLILPKQRERRGFMACTINAFQVKFCSRPRNECEMLIYAHSCSFLLKDHHPKIYNFHQTSGGCSVGHVHTGTSHSLMGELCAGLHKHEVFLPPALSCHSKSSKILKSTHIHQDCIPV